MDGEHEVVDNGISFHGKQRVLIDGIPFCYGFASPTNNNCLIDTLQIALPFHCIVNLDFIRQQLHRRFLGTSYPVQIDPPNYLDLGEHSNDILQLLGQYNTAGNQPMVLNTQRCTIMCVTKLASGNYQMQKMGNGPITMYIANEGLGHFVPLLHER